jgi:hypothetical protein
MTGVIYVVESSPEDFDKTAPINGAVDQAVSLDLSWEASSGATSYEYCIDDSFDSNCSTDWISTGTSLSAAVSDLSHDKFYQWQARAVNDVGPTEADNGLWWTFSTIGSAPASFEKTSPADLATGETTSPSLAWATSDDAVSYEYCIDTVDNDSCAGSWISTDQDTFADLAGLSNDTTYYWQVRARNLFGTTEADDDSWWQFSTQIAAPTAFSKSTPTDGQNNQPVEPSLSWQSSTDVTRYEYCFDTSDNDACNSSWVSVGTATNANLTGLSLESSYFWQVQAINAGGTTEANEGAWWRFSTVPQPPSAFTKLGPINNATDQSTVLTLSWATSSGVVKYEYCIDTTIANSCDTSWISVGNQLSVQPPELFVLTNYYWQIRAVNGGGMTEANADVWWNFQTTDVAEGVFDDGFESDSP